MSTLREDHKEVASGKKKDDEGYMANVELDSIERSIKNLRKSIKSSDTQLPAWVQSKITRASDYINTASEYLQSDAEVKEEKTLVQKILEDCGCSHEKCNSTKRGKSCPVHGMKACPAVMEEKDPKGPVQPYKSPEEIAKKHGVSLEAIQKQLKMGIKVEGEHTSDKKAARITALQHLDEVPDYYSKLKKVEKKSTKTESVTIEDMNGNEFVEFIDLIKPEPIYPQKEIAEATRINANVGNLVNVILTWRGRNFSLKVFFPQAKLPSRKEIEAEIQKIYPDGRVIYSSISTQEPSQSFLYAGGNSAKPGPNKNYVKPMGEEVELDEDWQKVNRKDKTDGLSQKAVNAYKRENPGSKLQTAVTEKKPTGKRAERRKSFCRRMSGMKDKLTSAETARDPDSRINKALRRWNCN